MESSIFGDGRLWKPYLSGSWKTDLELGRLLPPLLWLRQLPPDSCDGEVLVSLKNDVEQRPLVWMHRGRKHIGIDIEKAVDDLQHERYRPELIPPVTNILPFNYSVLPCFIKGTAKRILSLRNKPKPIPFPTQPYDFGTDFLILIGQRLYTKTEEIPWPGGRRYAVAISHDVDTAWVLRHPKMLEHIHNIEDRYGFNSTWHLVSNYLDDHRLDDTLNWLTQRGHELASHGDNHDVRHAFADDAERKRRWAIINKHVQRFDMKGFRSAWLARTNVFFDDLEHLDSFEYDSSVPNNFPHGVLNSNAGCASCKPFFIRPGIVEIPILWFLETLAVTENKWKIFKKSMEAVRSAGGIFTLVMHPQPHQSANLRMLDIYDRTLNLLSEDDDSWKCLQSEASNWIKRPS